MKVVVNGKTREIAEGTMVSDLVAELGLTAKNVVVEHNGEPLERARFGEAAVKADDTLEIVRAVPGG